MKNANLMYWIFTVLFGGFMLFTAIPDFMVLPDAVTFITGLGYPAYIVPFLGVAKALGVIAILVPGYPKIKEWAYAGLFFDLVGATYSTVATHGFNISIMFMLIPFVLEGLSYGFWQLKEKAA